MFRKFLVILLVLVLYFIYCFKFVQPQNFINFSLIDDGQSILYANDFKTCFLGGNCNQLRSEIIEKQFGRFRPLYWASQSLFVNTIGLNAKLQHEYHVYLIGGFILLLLVISMIQLKSNWLAILFGSAIFFGSFSFAENIIRLGPTEPFQVIFLALFSIFYLDQDSFVKRTGKFFSYVIYGILFTLLLLIKETSIAILPVIFIITILQKKPKKEYLPLVIISIIGGILFVASLIIAGHGTEVAYSSNYNLNPISIFNNFFSYFQLLYQQLGFNLKFTILLSILLAVLGVFKTYLSEYKKIYWLLVFIFFSLIVVPWTVVLQRYLLITMFSFSIVVAVIITESMSVVSSHIKVGSTKVKFFLIYIISFVLLSNVYFRGEYLNLVETINYQKWFTTFTQFEHDQVAAINTYSGKEKIYINATNSINDWEVCFEIPIHLRFFYNKNLNLEKVTFLNQVALLFSRSSLEPAFGFDILDKRFLKSSILVSKSYSVNQIDYIAFKDEFFYRPIQAFQNPPLTKNPIQYYWEIRQIQK